MMNNQSLVQTVTSNDFVLQSLVSINGRIPKRDGYILLVKRFNCRYCVEYANAYEEFASQNPSIGFLQFDAAIETELMSHWSELVGEAFRVDGYPTLIAYRKDGHPLAIIKNRHLLDEEIRQLFNKH